MLVDFARCIVTMLPIFRFLINLYEAKRKKDINAEY